MDLAGQFSNLGFVAPLNAFETAQVRRQSAQLELHERVHGSLEHALHAEVAARTNAIIFADSTAAA